MPYTTADLLIEIKQRAAIPTSQETYTNADLLRLATNELYTYVVPILMQVREEYLIVEKEYAVTDATARVKLPDRAVGGAVRDVRFRKTGGSINDEISVPFISPERVGGIHSSAAGFSCFFKWDELVIVGRAATGTLVVPYSCRPGELVETTAARTISSIDTSTNTVTFSSVPSSFTVNATYDFVSSKGIYQYLAIDQTPSSFSAPSITFSALPDGLAVGDYVTISEQTPVAQIPREFQPLLAQRVVSKVLESQGDHASLDRARRDLDEMAVSLRQVIEPRNPGEPKRIVSGMNTRQWWYVS